MNQKQNDLRGIISHDPMCTSVVCYDRANTLAILVSMYVT
jgi:hypothetical protein